MGQSQIYPYRFPVGGYVGGRNGDNDVQPEITLAVEEVGTVRREAGVVGSIMGNYKVQLLTTGSGS
jgi:hypothetical protein